jgi:hypothetical protein
MRPGAFLAFCDACEAMVKRIAVIADGALGEREAAFSRGCLIAAPRAAKVVPGVSFAKVGRDSDNGTGLRGDASGQHLCQIGRP